MPAEIARTDLHVVVLAAGKGTRMKSALPKVLHRAAGRALIDHVIGAADGMDPVSVVVIVGHQTELLWSHFAGRSDVHLAVQEPQLGTGHALLQAEPFLEGKAGTLLMLSGDVPLLRSASVDALVNRHVASGAAATVLTATVDRPDGYGRIVRDHGSIAAIVEHKDATPAERAIAEINSGVYAFDLGRVFGALRQIGSANAQGEYYLPDLVRIFRAQGLTVETVTLQDSQEILGVNSRKELAEVSAILRDRKNDELMASGVTIVDPSTTWVGPDVVVGPDTVLHPGVYLEGRTRIGTACEVHSGVRIIDSTVGDHVVINNFCVITDSQIERGATVGPFAHVRPQSHIGEDAHVGAFVELKKARLGRGVKAGHLAYLGDAVIGEKVNVGAGVITVNYDGKSKHQTTIEDGAFIGSDAQLIAPVTVGKGGYVAAGSSITEDVPPGALAIARGRQVNKPGWVARAKRKKQD